MAPRALPLLLCVLLLASAGHAQSVGPSPLIDLIEIRRLGRDLVAFGAEGGELRERLHLGERVLFTGSRGAVGVVLTDERMLAVATRSASWRERRYERGEPPPASAELGDRVALVATGRRALGFTAAGGDWFEYRLGPQEALHALAVGEQVGVFVTSRNALGLSPVRGRFQQEDLQVHERLERVHAGAAVATVRTSERVLVFRANTGAWSERDREIHDR